MLIVPALHPGAILRGGDGMADMAKYERTTRGDFAKAARLRKSRPTWNEAPLWHWATEVVGEGVGAAPVTQHRLVTCFPTEAEVLNFLGDVWRFGARLTFDVETTGEQAMDCRLLCIGLGFVDPMVGIERVLCVPKLSCGGVPYWTDGSWARVAEALRAVLGSHHIPKLGHNIVFDKLVMEAQGFPVGGYADDTMTAHHVLDSELPHGLGFVASTLLDVRFWKDDVKGDEGWLNLPDFTLRTYNLRDILVTMRLWPLLERQLKQFGFMP